MSKGLIDLKRANNPPENPLQSSEAPSAVPEAIQVSVANVNEPAAPSAAAVVNNPVPSTPQAERVSTIGARIPESLHQSIKLFCIANRIEMQFFVQEALTNHLASLQSQKSDRS